MRVYLAWAQKTKLAQTRDASHWLSEQIKTVRKRVAESEQAVETFRSTHGLVGGKNNATLESQQLSELNSQLILARAQRSEAEARASLIRCMLKEKGDVASAPDVLKSTLIQRLLEQRVRLRRELAELSATLLPSHPRIRELNSELADLQRQIRQEAKKVVASLENEAEIAGAREASLRASLNDLKKDASSAREEEIKLRSLEREAKANRDLLESYLARYGEASARRDESSVPAHASIISRARVQREPSLPKKGPISALVAAAVGLLSLATIIGRELMTGTHVRAAIRPEYEPVEEESYAGPPENEPAPKPIPVAAPAGKPETLRARSARAAARIIHEKCNGPRAHSLIVTPGSHHANTPQDALEVGRALAASGLKVGIVDFSTGGQGVAGLVGLSHIPGLGELLSGAARFEDVIHADPGGTVQIIAPGMLQKEVFGDGEVSQWRRVHNALAQVYDCVILHSSISGARRLLGGMADPAVTVLLVTGGKRDGGLAAQVADHLSGDGDPGVEIITYSGARPPKDRQGMLSPAGRQAAAV